MDSANRSSKVQKRGFDWMRLIVWTLAAIIIVLLVMIAGPINGNGRRFPESSAMQTTRSVELAMFQYAKDNQGHYPNGRSSTEVFQKLIDGQYLTAPEILCLKMPGKTPATSNHLLPENVAYDVTIPMDANTPDDVPGIFCTGYRIEYKPGGSAIPLPDRSRPDCCSDGLAIAYHSNNAFYKVSFPNKDGVVKNIIPADAKLGDVPFTQLTPYGPLETK